jgi:asparagine synthase (glutamine-hydrolysing)
LGFLLPSEVERMSMIKTAENTSPSQDHLSVNTTSFSDAPKGHVMLGGITAHRVFTAFSPPLTIFPTQALQKYGTPNHARTIAEAFAPQVREKAVSGKWHPLHVAQASRFLFEDLNIITNIRQYTTTKVLLSNLILNFGGERSEMANSIEGRPPFLDHKLSEYANTLPPYVGLRFPQSIHKLNY